MTPYLLSRLIQETLAKNKSGLRFVGHLGGDDFVLIVDPKEGQVLGEALVERFETESKAFFSDRDVERGYYEIVNRSGRRQSVPLLSLTVAIVHHDGSLEMHPRRLTDITAELRVYGKSQPGSIVVTDRRR